MNATIEQRTTCGEGSWSLHRVNVTDADGDAQEISSPGAENLTGECVKCGAQVFSAYVYTGSASLGYPDAFASVDCDESLSFTEPLDDLATKIGARMPFTVTGVRPSSPHRWTRETVLFGYFAGGGPVAVTVRAASDLRWIES